MTDLRQTSQFAKYLRSIVWIVERKNGTNYFIKKLPILGSAIKVQRPEKIDFQYIKELATKYRAFQIAVEPFNKKEVSKIRKHGFRLSKQPSLPSKTIHIDLTKSEKQMLSEMHYKTRYNIKIAKKRGVKIKKSNDINKFARFWQDCALHQRGMFLSQIKEIKEIYRAFGKNADLIFVLHSNEASRSQSRKWSPSEAIHSGAKGDELVSGILVLHANKVSYYMYAASSIKGKKLYAPTLNVWEAIRLSKKRGSKIFDFEGICDKRFPIKTWKGFSRFKKSFGGHEVEYPGAFVSYRLPI